MISYRGNPIPVFTIPPNWKQNPKFTEDHGTLIKEAISTVEQRMGDRHRGLWSIKYKTLSLTAQEMAYTRKVLETPAAIPFACGFWTTAVKLSLPSVIGTPYVDVDDASNTLFDILPYAMIWTAFNQFEILRMNGAAPNNLQFTDGVQNVWPAGSWVVPVTLGQLKRPDAQSVTDENDVFSVDFTELIFPDAPYVEQLIAPGVQAYELQPIEMVGIGGPLL